MSNIATAIKQTLKELHESEAIAAPIGRGPRKPAPSPAPRVKHYRRKPRPDRRVDRLGQFPMLAERHAAPTVIMAPESPIYGMPLREPTTIPGRSRPAARGAAAIIERLAGAGVRFELTPDREHLAVITQGGALPVKRAQDAPVLRELIVAVSPLVLAHLQGAPLRCCWCASEATTLLLPSTPACEQHAGADVTT